MSHLDDFSHLTQAIQDRLAPANAKLEALQQLDLFVLDNSLRESTVGQVRGHTLENKRSILKQVKKCGFKHIVVATFGHAPRVDDQFVAELCEQEKDDLSPYYAFSDIGTHEALPVGLTKSLDFGLRNIIFEIDLAFDDYSPDDMKDLLRKRILHVRDATGLEAQILVNLRDFPFTMDKFPRRVFEIVRYLGENPDIRPAGFMYEEPTGRFSIDALAAWTSAVRKLMNDMDWHGHLLAHVHEKWGFAAVAQLECLASGANGIWASLTNEGAGLGHASSTVSIMNLVRMGNTKVQQKYECVNLRSAARAVTEYTTGRPPAEKQIVFGRRALDQTFDFGGIAGGEVGEGDFDVAKFFGVEAPRRMSTLASPEMIQERLVNLFGSNSAFTLPMCDKMKNLMVADLIDNKKDEYMTPMGLALLFGRAGGQLTERMSVVVEQFNMKCKIHQQLISEVREEWDLWDLKEENKGDDCLEFYSFYNAFMSLYFSCYECEEARKALSAIDMDKDGQIDWREFELYLKWSLAQRPDTPTAEEMLSFAFTQGIIPDMQDSARKKEKTL